ncbi:MAG: hypothetical protein J6B65_01290 [Paludibacteraceae bacterium]|nr:hypothetical protein [Paludibacteraceae bacterium]
MKKFLSLVVIALLAISAFAQEPKKETVIVELFTRTGVVSNYVAEGVRNGVLQNFIEKGRFNIVDAATNAQLQAMNANRVETADEVNASNVLSAETNDVYKSLGANFLIKGHVTNWSKSYVKEALTDNYTYRIEINFTLTAYRISDGSVVGTKALSLTGNNREDWEIAEQKAIGSAHFSATSFVDEFFPFATSIEQIEEVTKGKKPAAKTLYILGGTEMGVAKGQLFVVKQVKQIGSRTTQVEIGKLKAVEAMDGITKCTVTKGGAEINDVFNSQGKEALVVISAGEAFLSGLFN